jgi:hypothetical protein
MDALALRINEVFDQVLAWANSFPVKATNRAVGLFLALPTTLVIAIAMWLTPSEKGYGTHTQLGLGGCTMMTLTGWPCPMCGMTTTFTLMAHLRPIDAFFTQPFGVVLFSVTAFGAVVGWVDLLSAVGLNRRVLRWIGRFEQRLAIGLLIGMMGGWIYKMIILHPHTFGL